MNWDWNAMSLNPNLTIDFIKENIHQNWNKTYISKHKNITMDFISTIDHPYFFTSYNPNITYKFMAANPTSHYNWMALSHNKSLTTDIVSLFTESMYWSYISMNVFKDTSIDIKKQMRFMKRRTSLYKEELILKTWHPSRVLDWCYDITSIYLH